MTERLPDLVGVAEVTRLLGLSRQRVYQLSQSEDFPAAQKLDMGHVWARDAVLDWARRTGRTTY